MKITFVDANGSEQLVEVTPGGSLMEAAVKNGVTGIRADCGGACSCATCHVFIPAEWGAKIPPKDDIEEAMLEFAIDQRDESRLSCQILLTDILDGLIVELPASQA